MEAKMIKNYSWEMLGVALLIFAATLAFPPLDAEDESMASDMEIIA
jgi:hypothetical protein